MKVTLLYRDLNYTALFKELPAGRSILFGAGPRSDLGISGDDIANVHFQISNDEKCVRLKVLAASCAPVKLNKNPVKEAVLNHQDCIVVGGTEVCVRIVGAPAAKETEEATAEMVATPSIVLAAEELPTGLVRWRDPSKEIELSELLEQLVEKFDPLLLANFRHASLPLPAWLSEEEDLFSGSSGETTREHSLHLIAMEEIGDLKSEESKNSNSPEVSLADPLIKLLELFDTLREKGNASLLFGKVSKEEMLEALKFRLGFFSTATGLEMFLKQGSPDLAQSLMASAAAILIGGADATEWSLYSNPSYSATVSDLKFAGLANVTPSDTVR